MDGSEERAIRIPGSGKGLRWCVCGLRSAVCGGGAARGQILYPDAVAGADPVGEDLMVGDVGGEGPRGPCYTVPAARGVFHPVGPAVVGTRAWRDRPPSILASGQVLRYLMLWGETRRGLPYSLWALPDLSGRPGCLVWLVRHWGTRVYRSSSLKFGRYLT